MLRCGRRQIFTAAAAIACALALFILLVYIELLPPPTKWAPSTHPFILSVFSPSDSQAMDDGDQPISKYETLSNDTFMIFSVYWDRRPRNSTPELMILAVSRCRSKTSEQPYAVFKDSTGQVSYVMQLSGLHMENDEDLIGCPPNYGCYFGPRQIFNPVSSILAAQLRESDDADRHAEVTLYAAEGRVVTVRPTWSAAKYDDTLAVCVPPLYWYIVPSKSPISTRYHDWRRILIFMAIWRAQGASHFYFYLNSCTKDVHKLLKYYEKQGYATIISYPDLPLSEDLDPNWTTYRLAHVLAINDCALRTKSRWAAHVDIDEVILMKNMSVRIIDWLKEEPDDVAGWSFYHHDLFFSERFMEELLNSDAKINPLDLEEALVMPGNFHINNLVLQYYRTDRRPPKVNMASAWYGHFRWNLNRTETLLRDDPVLPMMTRDRANEISKHIEQTRRDVFEKHLPVYNGWWAQKIACMVPMRTCTEKMMPLADWHFERTTDQVYTVL